MGTSVYKGFHILAQPYVLHESRRWTADLEIRHSGRSQPISLTGRYGSAREAESHCATVARLIIDGGMPKWSVDELRGHPGRGWRSLSAWKEVFMRPLTIVGIVLVVLGAVVLLRGASFTKQEDVVSLGDLSISAETRETIPPWVGGGAIVVGAALVVAGLKQRKGGTTHEAT